MSNLRWNSATELPFEILNEGGSLRHHVGINDAMLLFRPHHGHRNYEIALDRFIELVVANGVVRTGSNFTSKFDLTAEGVDTDSWIAFTPTEVVVKAADSSAKRAVGFDKLKDIVTKHGKPIGGNS